MGSAILSNNDMLLGMISIWIRFSTCNRETKNLNKCVGESWTDWLKHNIQKVNDEVFITMVKLIHWRMKFY